MPETRPRTVAGASPEAWLGDTLDANPDPHVVIAMSGGVDSSVAAMRVADAGLRCSALFMKNWNEPAEDGACHWEDDVSDALGVCERLDIPINTIDLSAEYWDTVFEDFLREYRRGRTPNPDVLCNREIKFRAFLEAARTAGGDLIATGHYVQRGRAAGAFTLERGRDANKDQSYFLYTLGQAQLARAVFPVGDLDKSDVRRRAHDAGLEVHDKKDSTGICFIGERRFREFLSRYVPAAPGPIVTLDGREIGRHEGAVYYTLGQRKGLGVGGVSGSDDAPWFVVAKDLAANRLTVAQGHDHPALLSQRLEATDLSWVAGTPPAAGSALAARSRHRQPLQRCVVDAVDGERLILSFDQPQRAVTPGQSVVLYRDETCLGGGIIDRTT